MARYSASRLPAGRTLRRAPGPPACSLRCLTWTWKGRARTARCPCVGPTAPAEACPPPPAWAAMNVAPQAPPQPTMPQGRGGPGQDTHSIYWGRGGRALNLFLCTPGGGALCPPCGEGGRVGRDTQGQGITGDSAQNAALKVTPAPYLPLGCVSFPGPGPRSFLTQHP